MDAERGSFGAGEHGREGEHQRHSGNYDKVEIVRNPASKRDKSINAESRREN